MADLSGLQTYSRVVTISCRLSTMRLTNLVMFITGLIFSTITLADGSPSSNHSLEEFSPEWEMAMQALRDEDNTELENIIVSHSNVINKVINEDATLLGMAAYMGNMEAVEILVENGADPNIAQGDPLSGALGGMSALLEPPSRSDIRQGVNIMMYLLDHGATLNSWSPTAQNAKYSLAEEYILTICKEDNGNQASIILDDLKDHNFNENILPEYTSNYKYIAELSKEIYLNKGASAYIPECVDYMFESTTGKGIEFYTKEEMSQPHN